MRASATPALVCGALILLCAGELWQVGRFHAEHRKLAEELTILRNAAPDSAQLQKAAATQRSIAEASEALARETARRTAAEASAKAVEAAIPGAKDEELRSVGHIEKFALGAAEWLEAVVASDAHFHATNGSAATDRENNGEFIKSLMEWVPKLSLISELEDTPADIAKLHASCIAKRLDLDGASLAAIRTQIERDFADLAAAGLTRSHCPEGDAKSWRARRNLALSEATTRVEALIPPARLKPDVVAQSLALGDAYFSEVQTRPDGHGSVNIGIRLPGLSFRF